MAHYDWDPALTTGIEMIDQQHRMLFALANRLSDAIDLCAAQPEGPCDADQEALADAIYGLTGYCVEHFSAEEDLMTAAGYPLLPAHRVYHAQLSGETLKRAAEYFNEEGVVPETLVPFFAQWLTGHILREDMRFVLFLREQRAQSPRG